MAESSAAVTGGLSVAVCCPTGRDSSLAERVLTAAGIGVCVCATQEDLETCLQTEVGAIFIAQEALTLPVSGLIETFYAAQPNWSDPPLVLLANSPTHGMRARLLELLPQATILERPIYPDLLVRTFEILIKARARQYELRDFMEQREGYLQAIEQANAAKDEFLGMVSHELRTPTSIVLGGANLLKRHEERLSREDKSQIVMDIDAAAKRLGAMVENLLLLARAESTDLREPMDVIQAAIEVIGDFLHDEPTRTVHFAEGPPLFALCNRQFFNQVLQNLLSNANKYSPPEEPIEVCIATSAEGIKVTVSDRGPGVAPEELDLIFQRFYRSQSTAGLKRGLGLGLTVCRRLIEAQGGTIGAQLPPEGGLSVHFCLEPSVSPEVAIAAG